MNITAKVYGIANPIHLLLLQLSDILEVGMLDPQKEKAIDDYTEEVDDLAITLADIISQSQIPTLKREDVDVFLVQTVPTTIRTPCILVEIELPENRVEDDELKLNALAMRFKVHDLFASFADRHYAELTRVEVLIKRKEDRLVIPVED